MTRTNERGLELTFRESDGRWCKVVEGTRRYFGTGKGVSDRVSYRKALTAYRSFMDQREADRQPRGWPTMDRLLEQTTGQRLIDPEGVFTVRAAADAFIGSRKRKVENGELGRRTLLDYEWSSKFVTDRFGSKAVTALTPADFAKIKTDLAKIRGPYRLGIEITQIRSIFKHAYESQLIDNPVRYGPEFSRPAKRVLRLNRQSKPAKFVTAAEIQQLLQVAPLQERAMIWLGINCGMGNTDVANLQLSHLDLDKGILDYARPKTGIERRATLWPETVEALQAVLAERAEAKDKADSGCVFLTQCRNRWVRFKGDTKLDAVANAIQKVANAAGIKRKGVRLYALRHTFETIAGETRDQPAVDRIMGHERNDMASVYREWVKDTREDARLKAVTEHVRGWLFAAVVREAGAA